MLMDEPIFWRCFFTGTMKMDDGQRLEDLWIGTGADSYNAPDVTCEFVGVMGWVTVFETDKSVIFTPNKR